MTTKLITVEKSRELELKANDGGLSYAAMMENAGRRLAEAVQRRRAPSGYRVLVLVGPGNNGGDGLVAAHYLSGQAAEVTCYIWQRDVASDPNFDRVTARGLGVVWSRDDPHFGDLRRLVLEADIIVDALLGVGADRPISGSLKDLLRAVHQALHDSSGPAGLLASVPGLRSRPKPLVVAVDCPSGLNCDTGALDPAALRADVTVTFAHPKVGLLRFPGAEAVGELVVADIGIPSKLADDVELEMATVHGVRALLPARPRAANKGTFGRALVIAGSVNYVGAAYLAGAAATRVGTGLLTLGLPAAIQTAVAARLCEATYLLLPHDLGVISSNAVEVVLERAPEYSAVLLGPGLTQEPETLAFVHRLLGLERGERRGRISFVTAEEADEARATALPALVVDADGLNALAGVEGWWTRLPPETILTPHPGEMARLIGAECTVREVQDDRVGTARRMAAAWKAVVVLKGAFTVVAAPDGRATVLPFANAGLATAGSGDVLSGAVVGLRAQGMPAYEAAVAGAFAHGLAGELVRGELGDMGMVAGDLPPRLPRALRIIREGE